MLVSMDGWDDVMHEINQNETKRTNCTNWRRRKGSRHALNVDFAVEQEWGEVERE